MGLAIARATIHDGDGVENWATTISAGSCTLIQAIALLRSSSWLYGTVFLFGEAGTIFFLISIQLISFNPLLLGYLVMMRIESEEARPMRIQFVDPFI